MESRQAGVWSERMCAKHILVGSCLCSSVCRTQHKGNGMKGIEGEVGTEVGFENFQHLNFWKNRISQ